MNISAKTKICMVIGDPIEHSLSPIIHNTGYKALSIDDQFVFVAAKVALSDIEHVVKSVKVFGIRGVSCTMPHKLEIMRYLDKVDKVAQKIGAVNTVVNNNGILTGYNTDWEGVVVPLEKKTTLKGKKVAVLGAGGAARAIVYGLTIKEAHVTIYNRTLAKAEEIAKVFSAKAQSLDKLEEVKEADIIVNATSIGMAPNPNETPLPKEYMVKDQIIFDAIYNPIYTKLIKEAKQQGAETISGLEMLLYQGTAQFALYTGHKAPEEEMKKVLLQHIK